MLIGITGTDGAGKGTVVNYLVNQKGFVHYSGRVWFLEVIKEQGIEPTRENMRLVANELRKTFGNDCVVREYVKRAKRAGNTNYIIESIRATAEVKAIKENGGILLAIDAPPELRYERITARGSSSDHISFAEFIKHEELEMQDPDPHGMQKAKVMAMADYTISNAHDLDSLHQEIETFLNEYADK